MNAHFPSADAAWQLAGWTMLHFLWVGTGVAVAGAAVRFVCRRGTPNVRYAASLATFVLLAASPIGIAGWLASQPDAWVVRTEQAIAIESAPADSATWGSFSEAPNPEGRPSSQQAVNVREPIVDAAVGNPSPSPSLRGTGNDAPLARLVAWLPWAWLVGAPITFAMLAAGLVGSQRLRRSGAMLTDGPVVDACARLRRVLGVARRMGLAVCDGLAQPVLVGIVKPTILLPAAALAGWSQEQLEMVLLHELAHVRRWDNLVNLGQRLVESLLFFHPAVWLVSRQVRRDREECCDALVIAHSGQPEAYASLLVSVAEHVRSARGLTALAASCTLADHALAGRVRRILKLDENTMRVSRRTLCGAMVVVLAATSAIFYRGARATDDLSETVTAPVMELKAVVYPATDIDRISGRYWAQLMSMGDADDATIRWNYKNHSTTITAPESFHKKIDLILRGKGDEIAKFTRMVIGPRALMDRVDALLESEAARGDTTLASDVAGDVRIATAPEASSDDTAPSVDSARVATPLRLARVDIPPDVSDANLQRIIGDFVAGGLPARLVQSDMGRVLVVETNMVDPIPVWRTHYVSGEVEKTCLLTTGPGPAGQAPPPASEPAAEQPRRGHTLVPGDGVLLRVVGSLPDQPLDDVYYIEPEGTLALGPVYGRVAIVGKSLAEAEAAVAEHLRTILSDAQVQLTLPRPAEREASTPLGRVSRREERTYRYNGKTLDQWRQESRYELMIGRRIDAINAFAVFGQTAMPREATEAIFDMAGEYDLSEQADSSTLTALRNAVLGALRLRNQTGPNGSGIMSRDWLPVLAERYASDEAKWKPLALFLLSQLTTRDKAPSDVLEEFEASVDEEIRAAAKAAREGRAGQPGGQVLPSDPPRTPSASQTPAGTRY